MDAPDLVRRFWRVPRRRRAFMAKARTIGWFLFKWLAPGHRSAETAKPPAEADGSLLFGVRGRGLRGDIGDVVVDRGGPAG